MHDMSRAPSVLPFLSRRQILLAGAAGVGSLGLASASLSRARPARPADLVVPLADGLLQIVALSDRAFRVRFQPAGAGISIPESDILAPLVSPPRAVVRDGGGVTRLDLPFIRCELRNGVLSFHDRAGRLLLTERASGRRLVPSQVDGTRTFAVEQVFDSPADEHLYGTGCFQDGYLNLRGLPRRLTQVNTQISLPFLLSSKGYGLLWHNRGMSEVNAPDHVVPLTRTTQSGAAQIANVTTTAGSARVARQDTTFEGSFTTGRSGRYAFLLDIGKKMASRHHVEIDGRVLADHANLWLPPTAGFTAELAAGIHHVRVLANADDEPTLAVAPVEDRTTWRSPVAQAVDYVVIAGPSAAEVMAGYRDLIGATPMMPLWAFGYIHCRERFHSSEEILATAREFRRRRLPVDMMVQDWQYWGKHGWNAMRFDQTNYPDPAGLCRDLHGMDMRLMLSVWSKISRDSDLGKLAAARGYYIPDTDWIDFFNPEAAAFYAYNQNARLASLGIDAWWQDATEPENDDLVGRHTAAGPGELVRLTYPLQVSRAVYEGQRRAYPDKRVMILTRSAFPGQQRYAAATWSGDIGNDWETLKRQIPAGLNMAAAGYPYWTVDAGGFFRPGPGQYSDPAYRERFLRWFQYATFLPLQRVHGYMTDTEFWRYGEEVVGVARTYLELRYRLLPYIYSLAAETTRSGMPLIRPLIFDFPRDPAALAQTHSFMFGQALHVAPVLAQDAREWPVYLPRSQGWWYDFWTGARREGGRTHQIPSPIDRVPLHVRAGSILPLGPVVQSTTGALANDLDIVVFPGRDGAISLYEDDGLTYRYEAGEHARVALTWDDANRSLSIDARQGQFSGMRQSRTVRIRLAQPGMAVTDVPAQRTIAYDGRSIELRL
jgi:alpha-D-xyloside xylohydrolase